MVLPVARVVEGERVEAVQVHVHVVEVLHQGLEHLVGEVGHVPGLHVLKLSVEDDGHARLRLGAGVLHIGVQHDVR